MKGKKIPFSEAVVFNDGDDVNSESFAAENLGIYYTDPLFSEFSWPDKFCDKYLDITGEMHRVKKLHISTKEKIIQLKKLAKDRVEVACQRINHFIKTGE